LLNKEMIAIDQDPLGKQGFKFLDEGDFEVWVKELAGEEIAVCFLNRSTEIINNKIDMESVIHHFNFHKNSYQVIDVWNDGSSSKVGLPEDVDIKPHGVVVYRLVKK